MIAKKEHIDYISNGLRNLFTMRRHALYDISICNDWVATVIQHLLIGKAVGIFIVNVSNRPITKYILSMYSLWFSAVKTFSTVIAVFKYFQSFNFKIRGKSL